MHLSFNTTDTLKTIGLVVLKNDETIEDECRLFFYNHDIRLLVTRIQSPNTITVDSLKSMENYMAAALDLFPEWSDFKVIGYGCTSASAVLGGEKITKMINTKFPKACVTNPMDALLKTLKRDNIQRLGFLTPYVEEVSNLMRQKIEQSGVNIVSFGSFYEKHEQMVSRIDEQSIIHAAHEIANTNNPDALFISCTNVRAIHLIPQLEQALKMPVYTSNSVLFNHMQCV